MTQHIAFAHTSFNVVLALVALPLLHPLMRIARAIAPGTKKEQTHLRFLHGSMVESPSLALEQGRLEVLHMAAVTRDALRLTLELYRKPRQKRAKLREQVLKKVGRVVRTRDKVRPVYVSIGHLIDQPSAEKLVLGCATGYRLPEPTRLADKLVAKAKKR